MGFKRHNRAGRECRQQQDVRKRCAVCKVWCVRVVASHGVVSINNVAANVGRHHRLTVTVHRHHCSPAIVCSSRTVV